MKRTIKKQKTVRFSTCDQVQQKTLNIDLYRTSFNFLLPENQMEYRSFLGACLTIMTLLLLISFSGYKMIDLLGYDNYKLQVSTQSDFFPTEETFGEANGLQYAAILTNYSGDIVEDPTIATLKFYYKSWGGEEDFGELNFRPIQTKACTDADFNNADENNTQSKFYPLISQYEKLFNAYKKNIKCMDEELEIYGEYNSEEAKNLLITIEKCDRAQRNDCKSDKEIDDWLTFKYIGVIENSKKLISHKFDSDRIQSKSKMYWYPVDVKTRTDSVRVIERSVYNLRDYRLNIGSLFAD